tara:strand:- start:512 stop:649 length:138 start_codon:yes stop_codon:yes gene_type:complete
MKDALLIGAICFAAWAFTNVVPERQPMPEKEEVEAVVESAATFRR